MSKNVALKRAILAKYESVSSFISKADETTTIYKYINDKVGVSAIRAEEIAHKLRVPVSAIFSGPHAPQRFYSTNKERYGEAEAMWKASKADVLNPNARGADADIQPGCMTPESWITNSRNTCQVSLTMYRAIYDIDPPNTKLDPDIHGIPTRIAEFRRCYRAYKAFPHWQENLYKVAKTYPAWRPYVEAWDELVKLYTGYRDAALQDRLQELKCRSIAAERGVQQYSNKTGTVEYFRYIRGKHNHAYITFVVHVDHDTKTVYLGNALRNPKDQPNKAIAREVARGRMMKAMSTGNAGLLCDKTQIPARAYDVVTEVYVDISDHYSKMGYQVI